MSNESPPPPPESPQPPPESPPPAPASPAGVGYAPVRGQPPEDIGGVFYSKGLTILLMIVTLGIWGFFWTYRTNEDLKRYNGDGLGGWLGVVIYLLLSVILMFTIPNEIKNSYERDGRPSPVSALWGLWFLLPIIGHFVWYLKVQGALNDFWRSKGARG
jgi:hypothetical protein